MPIILLLFSQYPYFLSYPFTWFLTVIADLNLILSNIII